MSRRLQRRLLVLYCYVGGFILGVWLPVPGLCAYIYLSGMTA